MLRAVWVFSLLVMLGYAYESYLGAVVMGVVGFGIAQAVYQKHKEKHSCTERQRFEYFSSYFVLLGRMCYLSNNHANSRDLFLTQLKLFNLPRVEENNAVKLFESGFNHTVALYNMIESLKYSLPSIQFVCVLVFRLSQVEKSLNRQQKQLLVDILEQFGLSALLMFKLLTEYMPRAVSQELKPYFEILELSPEASFEELKLQYRRLVKLYHPDKTGNIGDDEKVQSIIRAYEILKVYYQQQKLGENHVV